MNERDFLSWMFEKYNVSDFSIENITPKYINGLSCNIDYYKMRDFINIHCKSMPNTLEINKIAKDHNFYNNAKSKVQQHIEEIKRTPKLDLNALDDRIKKKVLAFCHKYGAKTKLQKEILT